MCVSAAMEKNRDLHLTEEELDVAEIVRRPEITPKQHSTVLIVSLLSTRPFNAFALNSTMKGAWRVKKGFNFREISMNLFSFQFSDVSEKNRILNNGPWSFDKALLILREPSDEQPMKMKFESAHF